MKRNGIFFGVLAVTAFACGGIDEPAFFSSDGTTTSSQDSGTSNADSGHTATTDSGTSVIDSGIVTVIDSGAPLPADPGIFCGTDTTGTSNVYCDPNTEFCCASGQELGQPSFACGTDKNSCTNDALGGGVVIPCDKPSECGGQYCCGTFDEGSPSQYTEVRCQSSCAGTSARIFCDPANGDSDCRGTGTCGESGTLPGFYVCSVK